MSFYNLEGSILSGLPYDTKDMIELDKCKELCNNDPKCKAFTHGFKCCYLFDEFIKAYSENSIGIRYHSCIKTNQLLLPED